MQKIADQVKISYEKYLKWKERMLRAYGTKCIPTKLPTRKAGTMVDLGKLLDVAHDIGYNNAVDDWVSASPTQKNKYLEKIFRIKEEL